MKTDNTTNALSEASWQVGSWLTALVAVGAAVLLLAIGLPGVWATPQHSPSRQTVGPAHAVFGTVFDDKNQNGQRDRGEPGIAGVTITLTASSTLSTTTTSSTGDYEFRNLTGGQSYTVTETDPNGYASSTPNQVTVRVPDVGPGPQVDFGDYVSAATDTPTPTETPTSTPTSTPSPTATSTPTMTPSPTSTATPTPTSTPTETASPSGTPTSTDTPTPTATILPGVKPRLYLPHVLASYPLPSQSSALAGPVAPYLPLMLRDGGR